MFSLVLLGSCSKETVPENNDEYYVKYIVNSPTIYSTTRTASIRSETNSLVNYTFTNYQWEMIIGPVGLGFNSSVSASHNPTNLAQTYMNVEIHVSKNNGPFALKAIDDSQQVRYSASTSYTINF